jgi:hypothetical protein
MSKSKGTFGTPVNHVGPKGAFIGNAQGRTPGLPAGMSGSTVKDQYRGSGIDTRPAPNAGTRFNDAEGNPDEASRVVSQHRYGVSPGAGGVDMNDPAANGSGVVFDGAKSSNGYMPNPGPAMDSPVGKAAPYFEGRSVEQENRAHLGQGNQDAARDDLRKIPGGVMSRE